MRVHMDCVGCESRVKAALQKMRGGICLISSELLYIFLPVYVTYYLFQKTFIEYIYKKLLILIELMVV